MENFYSILVDLGILGFFGLLYYLFQRRRIIKASTREIQDHIQEFLYELHSFLENNKSKAFYSELDQYALRLEESANTDDLQNMRAVVEQSPHSLPENLQADLRHIKRLF